MSTRAHLLVQARSRFRRVVSAVGTRAGLSALRHGVVSTLEPQPMLLRLRPSIVVDVGANRGQFALDVTKAVPRARIVAFEPLANEAAVFRKLFSTFHNVELHQRALGAAPGKAQLHVAGAADSSSLLRIGDLQEKLFPGTAEVEVVDVDVETLDHALAEVDLSGASLLKIDVQGYELEVLRGGPLSLSQFRWVYVELSFVELYKGQPLAHDGIAFLAAASFVLVDTGIPSRVEGRTIQQDFLFERATVGDDVREK